MVEPIFTDKFTEIKDWVKKNVLRLPLSDSLYMVMDDIRELHMDMESSNWLRAVWGFPTFERKREALPGTQQGRAKNLGDLFFSRHGADF